MLALFWY
jgi:hypothetical protein